ncbi:MAG: hypothetical protein JNK65_01145, partial [Deltaproteobacteria bacterium]|nr:hypothetical protein [Deltaproteobacteria bacterium]
MKSFSRIAFFSALSLAVAGSGIIACGDNKGGASTAAGVYGSSGACATDSGNGIYGNKAQGSIYGVDSANGDDCNNNGGSNNGGNNNGGGTVDPGTGTGNAQNDAASLGAQGQALAYGALNDAIANGQSTLVKDASVAALCTSGGPLLYTGPVTLGNPITFDIDINYNGCNGVTGNINETGSVSVNLNTLETNFNIKLNGDFGGFGC